MNSQNIELGWYKALTLEERKVLYKKAKNIGRKIEYDYDLAEKRLSLLKQQKAFINSRDSFAKYLSSYYLDEDMLKDILGLSEEYLFALCKEFNLEPRWAIQFRNIYFAPTIKRYVFSQGVNFSPFLPAVEPIIRYAHNKIAKTISKLETTWEIKLSSVEVLLTDLCKIMSFMIDKVFTLELNIARLRGLLSGNNSEERFVSFIQQISEVSHAYKILSTYPILARSLVQTVNLWIRQICRFLDRLAKDWSEIALLLESNNLGEVVQVRQVGDNHRGFHSTKLVEFSCGKKVIYKPRPLSPDINFYAILSFLNLRIDRVRFYIPKIIDKSCYGWMEFVPYQECNNLEEVGEFYRELGALLAVFHIVGATDLHYANLIARGGHPVPIDLETLLSYPQFHEENDKNRSINRITYSSILRVGLLPNRSFTSDDGKSVDLSAMGANDKQLWPDELPMWEEIGLDTMHLGRAKLPIFKGIENLPKINGENVDYMSYINSFVQGFRETYSFIYANKEQAKSILSAFKRNEIRIVLRPTRVYSELISTSFHPDLLQDALEREAHWSHLWLSFPDSPLFKEVILEEKKDLNSSNIPLFTALSSSVDIYSSSRKRIRAFLKEQPILSLMKRCEDMSSDDLARQEWLIRAALIAHALNVEGQMPQEECKTHRDQFLLSKEEMIEAAKNIGDRLLSLAIGNGSDITWLGLRADENRQWTIKPLGEELYAGLAGIALFFAYLGIVTKIQKYLDIALFSINSMNNILSSKDLREESIGAFSGLGGAIYSLLHLGVLTGDKKLIRIAYEYIGNINNILPNDRMFDIIGGAAGCLACLLAFYRVYPWSSALNAAILCGDHLLQNAQHMKKGLCWWSGGGKKIYKVPPAGFAHGVAGIAWSLYNLYEISHIPKFKEAAMQAIEYERTLFVPEKGNWIDARKSNGISSNEAYQASNYILAWCHGAPGIGLGRLGILRSLTDQKIEQEVRNALAITLEKGFGFNYSLCHGDFGNIELLLVANNYFHDLELSLSIYNALIPGFSTIGQKEWFDSMVFEVEVPGLMPGLAGIGYGLLRLANPQLVPSILLLEGPILEKTEVKHVVRYVNEY